jgi:hypothetical protein
MILRLFSLSLLLIVVACSSSQKPVKLIVKECFYPDNNKENAPLWVCGAPVEVNGVVVSFTAVGSAPKSKAGINFTTQQATANARLALAQQLDSTINASVKESVESRGSGSEEVVNNISSLLREQTTKQQLVGSKILAQTTSSNGTMYIIIGLDPQAYKTLIKQVFDASYSKNKAEWEKNLNSGEINKIKDNLNSKAE